MQISEADGLPEAPLRGRGGENLAGPPDTMSTAVQLTSDLDITLLTYLSITSAFNLHHFCPSLKFSSHLDTLRGTFSSPGTRYPQAAHGLPTAVPSPHHWQCPRPGPNLPAPVPHPSLAAE